MPRIARIFSGWSLLRLASSTKRSSRRTRRGGLARPSLPPKPKLLDDRQAPRREVADAGHLPPPRPIAGLMDLAEPGLRLFLEPGHALDLGQLPLGHFMQPAPESAVLPR